MATSGGLPSINRVGPWAPFGWLAGALGDLGRAPVACLAYGLGLALISLGIVYGLYASKLAFWAFAVTLGFVFIAPMLAMGLYEAGRQIEQGRRPGLGSMLLVTSALRRDLAYLGLALLLIFMLWGQFAQIVYGLSTYQIHRTVGEFVHFALATSDGHTMLITGSVVGGAVAFLTFTVVVISAPMLLDRHADFFVATITSFRAVAGNFGPMMLWALLIVLLMLLSVATGFLGLIVIFPWLGLASWRAYRALVAASPPLPAAA